jgi:hypothetical protein
MILLKFGGITMPKKEEIKSLEEDEDEEDPEMDPDESEGDGLSDDDEF